MTFDFGIAFAEPYFTIDGASALHLNVTSGAAASAAAQYHFEVTLCSTGGRYSQSFAADMPAGQSSLTLAYTVPLAWADDFAVNLADSAYPDACGLFTAAMTVQCASAAGAQTARYELTGYQAQLPATVAADILPSAGSLTAQAVDGRVPAGWGVWIQGVSVARITCAGACGAYGSTILAYEFGGAAQQQNTADLCLSESGTVTIPVAVVDSRLRRAQQQLTLEVQPYAAPALTCLASRRCDASGAADPAGDCLAACCTAAGSTLGGKNPLTVQCAWKSAAAAQYGEAVTLAEPETPQILAAGLTGDTGFDVKYTVADAFYTAEFCDYVPGTAYLLHFRKGGDGVAVGKAAEHAGLFDVAYPARLRGGAAVDGGLTVDGADVGSALCQSTAAFALEPENTAEAAENLIVKCGRALLFRLQCTLNAPAAGAAVRLAAAPAGYYSTAWPPAVTALQNGVPCKGWIDRDGYAWIMPNADGLQNAELYGFGLV